jgi:hypothetical protein
MTDIKQKYISLIQKRSGENEKALRLLFTQNLIGNCVSTLRQELDSFIRVMYLGRISDFSERERLMNQTLLGEKWSVLTANNKWRQITDKEMVEKSTELKGYIQYVYKFGCGFIHLSDFHNYKTKNPFDKLDYSEQFDIIFYLHQYHSFPRDRDLTIENITSLIPAIFEKISANMAYYFDAILNDGMIEM